MPDLSSHASQMRDNSHHLRGWLSVFKGTSVCSGTISATPTTYPYTDVAITVLTGSHTVIERGAEIAIYTAGDFFKGRLRVRRAGTISSTNLPVAETAKASLPIVLGDKFVVLNEHRPRPVIPAADTTFAPDHEVYTDQNLALPPLAVTGGPICAWVDTGQTYATLDFFSSSYVVDADSAGTMTHAWTFPAGSTPTSSTSASPANVQIPAGEHWVKYVVTDSTNSKTHTRWVPVWVHNTANPPYEVEVESLNADALSGWGATFKLQEQVTLVEMPDGALVVFWIEEYIGSAIRSLGNSFEDRSNNKFVGWHASDRAEASANGKTLRIEAISALRVLSEMVGFSKALDTSSTAADWQQLDDLTDKRAIIQILKRYSTALDVCDLTFHLDATYTYPAYYVQKNTPFEQVKEIAAGIDARFVCTRTGQLQVQTRHELSEYANRDLLTTTYTFTPDDIISMTISRPARRKIDLLELKGIYYQGTGAFFSRYPGLVTGEFSQSVVYDRKIASSQTNMNIRCGMAGAWEDKVHINEGGVYTVAPQIELEVRGSYDTFDFYREWLEFDIDVSYDWRGYGFNLSRFFLLSVNVTYENGTATVRLSLQGETASPPGATYDPPSGDPASLPESDWTLPSLPGVPTAPVFVQATDNIAAITANGHIFVTSNFTNASPTWTDHNISASLQNATVQNFVVDPRSPFYQGTGPEVNGWVTNSAGVDYIEDIFSATPSISADYTYPLGTTSANGIDVNFTRAPGRFGVVVYGAAESFKRYRAATYDGSTWTEQSEVITDVNTAPAGFCAVSIDPHSTQLVYLFDTGGPLMASAGASGFPYDDPDYVEIDAMTSMGGFLYMALAQNPVRYIYYRPDAAELYRGDLLHDIALPCNPYIDADTYDIPDGAGRFVVGSPSGNANRIYATGDGPSGYALFRADDAMSPAGPTWEALSTPSNSVVFHCVLPTDPDGAGCYVWGAKAAAAPTSYVGFWNGTTLQAKTGTGFTTSRVVALVGA